MFNINFLAAGCIGLKLLKKKAIALAFFFCGCNQSQIFPRSTCKGNILFEREKRVLWILLQKHTTSTNFSSSQEEYPGLPGGGGIFYFY
jgi:hypothetical protein